MRLKDINTEIIFELWMKPESVEDTVEMGSGYIDFDNSNQAYKLMIKGKQWKVKLRDISSGINLNFHLKRGCARLVEVMQVAKDGSIFVKIIFFNGEIVEIGNIEIGIDERIKKTAERNGIEFNTTEDLCSILQENCKISIGNKDFFVFLCGPAAEADFEVNGTEDENILNSPVVAYDDYQAFSIFGEKFHIPVERRNIDKLNNIFFATKAVFKDNQNNKGALHLARGSIKFSDYTKTGYISALAAGSMSLLTKENGSYLKKWDEYGEIEGELLLSRAKAVGRIDYTSVEKTIKGVKFFISYIPELLSEGDEIEITSEEPLYLLNPDITWMEYSKTLENEFIIKKEQKKNNFDNNEVSISATILNISKTSIELDLPSLPYGNKFLILSINGDKIQIERRMQARSAILKGYCANPLLGLIIEEGGVLPDIQRVTKLKPLTRFVKEKIFNHPPTDRQIEAIDIALNTPDIAIIQGPPGTGKTTVVTAILERLNEEYDKTNSIRGQILVSGFQHDAVENIVSRLSINALPAVKFGKRSGDSEFSEDVITQKLNQWCQNVANLIRKNNPQITQSEEQLQLFELFQTYSLCPSINNTINLINRIIALPREIISEEILLEAEEIINSLHSDTKACEPSILRLIRSLRINKIAFEDDGPARAIDLLDKLEEELSSKDIEILEKAARWHSKKQINFLPELKALKKSLLYRYLPSPEFRIEKPREDVLKLVAEVSQILEKKLNINNKRDTILAEFLHELEDNPNGIREAIEDYNFVFAATTQQSVGSAIIRSKNKYNQKDKKSEMAKYDTVIVDEAARASPRDLLIPMAQAEKRIILVGDHRQLPHLIDEEVARILEGNSSSIKQGDVDFVKKSMFEYLFNRLKKLEEKDSIKRTVTLDAQYRTHPLLGKFISNNFYSKYNEGFRSPLPEKNFMQKLQGIYGKAAVWINIPNAQGKEQKLCSGSRKRTAEAQAIAEYINKWINSPEGTEMSFGIISFYKAQVFTVYESLRKFNITERAEDGTWQIALEYRFLENGEERLRIGTVDAFQGMEFDFVFLSMVRSQDINNLTHISGEDYKKKQHKIFGHLMSENRLCVSMSRQKKVLAVVGDGSLANSQIAIDAVPAIKNFYDLCKDQGAIL